MNLVFMGTPEFAVPSLEKLIASHHSVMAVVTRPDTEQGRGRRVCPSPVKVAAENHKLSVLQPARLTDSEFLRELTQFAPDLLVVVAFRILPEAVFAIPRFGAVNLHASLLPRYRGAAPIQWAIVNGERETGLTTFRIDVGVDTGGILLQRAVAIGRDETAGALHDRMMVLGADLLAETVDGLESGVLRPGAQEEDAWPPAPRIRKEDALIDWSKGAPQIRNLVRGMNPAPGAYTTWRGEILKVHRVDVAGQSEEEEVEGARVGNQVRPREGDRPMSGHSGGDAGLSDGTVTDLTQITGKETERGGSAQDIRVGAGGVPGSRAAATEEEVDEGERPGGSPVLESTTAPGTIVTADPRDGVTVSAGASERLLLREVQLPGKRPVTSAEWVRGHGVRVGERLGE